MDILIQSLLDRVRKFNASLHIRYYARAETPEESVTSDCQDVTSHSNGGRESMTSYVIIRREYSYLEPLIRSIFDQADDVEVLIDRRSDGQYDGKSPETEGERRRPDDRRSSAPMLDILINVQS